MIKWLILVLLIFSSLGQAQQTDTKPQTIAPSQGKTIDVSRFEPIAIQVGGRVKPFDTFARESVFLITGRSRFQGKNPTEVVLSWLFLPDQWKGQKFFQIKHHKLKEDLGIPKDAKYVSPQALVMHHALPSIFTQLNQLQKQKKKLDSYFTAVQRLNNQLFTYKGIIAGSLLRFIPQKLSKDWIPVTDFNDEATKRLKDVAASYFLAVARQDQASFDNAVMNFETYARAQAPKAYPSKSSLKIEMDYNRMQPFRIAWIMYLLASIFFAFSMRFTQSKNWYRAAFLATFTGFIIHTVGFTYRCLIAGRPPVSNMYESVIWVALGTVFFGIIFEMIYKKRIIGLAATVVATICLIAGDSAPAILDQSIKPLEPVLRSNYWLTVHVLTITLSYAAFALSMGLGNIGLWYYIRGQQNEKSQEIKSLSMFAYRCVQVGVLLLTAGTILGGVWADESWGRFWGWDPKENWALVTDLVYLAVLHGRFTGWLRSFGFLATIVCCFSSVIMAWYGVNFWLGAGLHSYGFGTGGFGSVSIGVLIQLAYVGLAVIRYKGMKPKKA